MEKQKKKLNILIIIAIVAIALDVICIKFSFWRQGLFFTRFFAFLVSTNIFLKQLTNGDKKTSKWGTIIICLSSATLTGMNFDVITFGEIFLIFLNKITDSEISKDETEKEKKIKKLLYCLGIIISALAYIFTLNLSLEISFGYVFLALAIWICIKNRKKYKVTKKAILAIVAGIIFIAMAVFLAEYCTQIFSQSIYTYTSQRDGNGLAYNFSYIYNFLMPYKDSGHNIDVASMISVFPVPIILAMFYLYKKEKHEEFLFPMLCIITLEIVWSMINLPEIISTITGLKLVTVKDATLAVALANIYIYLYMFANVKEEAVSFTSAIRITLLLLIFNFFIPKPENYTANVYNYIFAGVFTLESFLMLCYTDPKYKTVALWIMAILTIVGVPIVFSI